MTSRGRTRRWGTRVASIAALAATAVLAGCGAEDSAGPATMGGPAGMDGLPSDPTAYVDPCALLSSNQVEDVADGASQLRAGLGGTDNSLAECTVTGEDRVLQKLAFGYAMSKGADVEARRSSITRGGGKVVAVPVGDVSFYSTSNSHFEAWGQAGDYTVFVSSLSYYPDKQQTETLLRSMLSKARPAMFEHQRQVPSQCPRPTDPRIEAVLGTVKYAVGSGEGADISCDYGSERLQLKLTDAKLSRADYKEWASTASTRAGPFATQVTLARAKTYIAPNKYASRATGYLASESTVLWLNLEAVAGLDASARLNPKLFKHKSFDALTRWWVPRRVNQLG